LEIWRQTSEGLVLAHSRAIHGQISMLAKLHPHNATTDHLFIGTDRFQYFTATWNGETRQLDTVQSFVDVSEKHMRDSQSLDRCLVDPTGQYMVMELFEGVLNLVKVIKPRKGGTSYLDDPEQIRISELFVRSSTFLYTESKRPKVALLYQDLNKKAVQLATYRLTDEKGQYSQFDAKKDRENELDEVDAGASAIIPVQKGETEQKRYIYRNNTSAKAQLGGLIVVGETTMLYLDDESKATVEYALDEASIFVAWETYDNLRYLLADDYGWLHLLTLLVDGAVVTGMDVKKVGEISKPSAMIYLGNEMLYIGSHAGDSQVVRLDIMGGGLEVLQVMPNIAPILDFTIMDMGSREGETQSNEYSTGQVRLVTGSGVFKSGSLRSVRSGVGLEDIGLLGDIENIRALYPLRTSCSKFVDTLVMSFLTETRIFRFDNQGEVEEVENFLGMSLIEQTLLALNVSDNRVLQITPSRLELLDVASGIAVASWKPQNGGNITAGSANRTFALVAVDGKALISLDIQSGLSQVARQDVTDNEQVSCVSVPNEYNVGLVGFWQSGSISLLNLTDLKLIQGETVRTPDSAAVPRSIVMTQILASEVAGPTLLVGMSDGTILTFAVDKNTFSLSGRKSIMLGIQHATFEVIPRGDGLCNVFAICEHSSLIYGSGGRIVYSAVTAENATCICLFNSVAYPDAVVIATAEDVKISQIDTQRRTHVRTLHIPETVRRITYSVIEKVFALGCVKRELIKGEERVASSFRIVDEVVFGELGKPFVFDTKSGVEMIECVTRAELPDAHGELVERFIVGTSYLDDDVKNRPNGRIRVFGIDKNRNPYEILNHGLKGACRALAILDGKIIAALMKTVVMYSYTETSTRSGNKLEKIATYRPSTVPVDLAVTGNIIAVADLMKSICILEYTPGKDGVQGELVEVARHFQMSWATAVSHIEDDSYLESDGDGNLTVLRRNVAGVTLEDRQRMEVTSEMNIGEMVNRIRKIDVETSTRSLVVPRAFLATVSSSIQLTVLESL
jgi:DNA damage-binding protein 1